MPPMMGATGAATDFSKLNADGAGLEMATNRADGGGGGGGIFLGDPVGGWLVGALVILGTVKGVDPCLRSEILGSEVTDPCLRPGVLGSLVVGISVVILSSQARVADRANILSLVNTEEVAFK